MNIHQNTALCKQGLDIERDYFCGTKHKSNEVFLRAKQRQSYLSLKRSFKILYKSSKFIY